MIPTAREGGGLSSGVCAALNRPCFLKIPPATQMSPWQAAIVRNALCTEWVTNHSFSLMSFQCFFRFGFTVSDSLSVIVYTFLQISVEHHFRFTCRSKRFTEIPWAQSAQRVISWETTPRHNQGVDMVKPIHISPVYWFMSACVSLLPCNLITRVGSRVHQPSQDSKQSHHHKGPRFTIS